MTCVSCECICARPCWYGKLVRARGFVKHGCPLLRERARNEAAKGVVCGNAPDSVIGLAQSR